MEKAVEAVNETLGSLRIVYLVIGECVAAAETVKMCPDQRLLVQILPLLAVFVNPKVGEECRDLVGHKTGEDGVAGILRSGRENGEIEVLVDVKQRGDLRGERAPVVVAQIVNDNEEEAAAAFVETGKDITLHDVGREQGTLCAA